VKLTLASIRIELESVERFEVEAVKRHGMTDFVDIEVQELVLRHSEDRPKIEATKGSCPPQGNGYFPGAFLAMKDLPRWLRREIAEQDGTEPWFGCER